MTTPLYLPPLWAILLRVGCHTWRGFAPSSLSSPPPHTSPPKLEGGGT